MHLWQALVLGFTQGITEFLPVSSSGHLALLQGVFGISLGGAELFFDIILHLGTLVAVCIIFYRDILNLFKKPYKKLLYLILASIPAAVTGLILNDIIKDKILGGSYVGFYLSAFFLITAATLLAAEIIYKRAKASSPLALKNALYMGAAQAAAILPGISRSGSTVAAGLISGADSEEVSSFSFLMSLPVILGGFILELAKFLSGGSELPTVNGFGWCAAVGFVASALSGLAAIKIMLNAIKKANYKPFSIYLAALSIASIILQCTGCFK